MQENLINFINVCRQNYPHMLDVFKSCFKTIEYELTFDNLIELCEKLDNDECQLVSYKLYKNLIPVIMNKKTISRINFLFDHKMIMYNFFTDPSSIIIFKIIEPEKIINWLIEMKDYYTSVNLFQYLSMNSDMFKYYVENFMNYSINMRIEGQIAESSDVNIRNIQWLCELLGNYTNISNNPIINLNNIGIHLISMFCPVDFFANHAECKIPFIMFISKNTRFNNIDEFIDKLNIQTVRFDDEKSIMKNIYLISRLLHYIMMKKISLETKLKYIDKINYQIITDEIENVITFYRIFHKISKKYAETSLVNKILDIIFGSYVNHNITITIRRNNYGIIDTINQYLFDTLNIKIELVENNIDT